MSAPGGFTRDMVRALSGRSHEQVQNLIDLIVRIPKFLLHFDALPFDSNFRGLPQTMRLPFDGIAIEVCHHIDPSLPVDTQRRRSVLYAGEADEEIFVFSFEETTRGGWYFMPVHFGFSKDPAVTKPRSRFGASGYPEVALAGMLKVSAWEREPTDDECIAAQWGGVMVISLIQLLACSNVRAELVEPSQKLRRAAAKRGRLPFFSYHVLTIPGGGPSTAHLGGTHASPRQHVRRGHVRRLRDARTVWVNQCLVGDARRGLVAKDYAVIRPELRQ